jgi:LuxR family maltose regulon positive regulatory protein
MHQNIVRKLVLIAATAGYGKTSLVVDFARDTDFPVAWLALDETDRDVGTLAADLVHTLQRFFPDSCASTQAMLSAGAAGASQPEQLAAALAGDMDRLPSGYFVVCLDDYHLVAHAEAVGRFVTRLLNLLPEQAHLVMTSRAIPPPPFPIVPLAARQEIAGLNEEQLRFSGSEIQALLQLRNQVAMPEAEAERLAADTEGWITGILLSSHLMWQGLMAAWLKARQADSPVYDYLADEVLSRLSPDLRQFLVESAILPDMDAQACDEVLNRDDSGSLLRQAEEQRLFISGIGDEVRSFRYHQLFREFLLSRLEASAPDRARELRRRAAQWYEQHGWPETAVTFYLAAGDSLRAAAIAEAHAQAVFTSGRHETLRRWGDQLATVAHEAPRLLLYLSKVYTDAGNLDAATSALDTAASVLKARRDREGQIAAAVQLSILTYRKAEYGPALRVAQQAIDAAEQAGLLDLKAQAERYLGLCHFALGDLAAAEATLSRTVPYLEQNGQNYNLALAQHDLARILKASGKTTQAMKAQWAAMALWREQGNLGQLAIALNNTGWDRHMLGHYEEALGLYAEALGLARRAGSGRAEILVLASQGDLLAELGDLRQAAECYGRALDLADRLREPGFKGYLYRANARLDRWQGNHSGALEWLRRSELAAAAPQTEAPGTNSDCLRGTIGLEMGRALEALELLERLCIDLMHSSAVVDLASCLFAVARARLATGDSQGAFSALGEAFDWAEQVGYDQMLVAEAPFSRDLLQAASLQPQLSARAESLAARADAAHGLLARTRSAEAQPKPARRALLEVEALGSSRVLREGRELPKSAWASQQTRELFLYLVDNSPVHRVALIDQFWPSKSAARAAANLHQAIYQVRKALGHEAVQVQDSQYSLAAGLEIGYDVVEFEREARTAMSLTAGDARRTGALSRAIGIYRGEYLADLPADWAQQRRRQLGDLFLQLLRCQAEELMAVSLCSEARQVLVRALEIDPLGDDINALMLRCLAALGRRNALVEHYQVYRERLRTDLGLDPPESTRQLYGRLIR